MPSFKTRAYWLIPLVSSFAALAAVLAVTWWISLALAEQMREVRRITATKFQLTEFIVSLKDAAIGERGFLLTGKPSFLEPFERAKADLGPALDQLVQGASLEPTLAPLLSRLRVITQEKLALLQTSIDLKKIGHDDDALTVLGQGHSKELLDEATEIVARVKDYVLDALDKCTARTRSLMGWVQVGQVTAALLVMASAGFAFQLNRRQLRALVRAQDTLILANKKLVAESAERVRVSAQLRQSQKMEVIGQLTGGIAHDFNNMLAVIVGSLSLFKRRVERGDMQASLGLIDDALGGASRAATLTARLLAFSRQQPLAPVALDPNKLIAGMSNLLSRTLGQNIQVEIVFAGAIWRAYVDANQLENALLNLCINSRDAMPQGGQLTIETSNAHLDEAYVAENEDVSVGQYVQISVTDTGTGMSPEVAAKAFEPFFTTKTAGEGTGLGLSQVFGFVKQSGGHIKIYSEPGQGTTIKLYLPRYFERADAPREPDFVAPSPPQGRTSEMILVVEDEERVRKLNTQALRELGYTVIHAGNAATALRVLEANPSIDLLLTDVVLPEIDGRRLADEALRRNPELKVVFTTGFTRNAIVHNGALDPDVHLITKPFNLMQLARKIRQVLDEGRAGNAIEVGRD